MRNRNIIAVLSLSALVLAAAVLGGCRDRTEYEPPGYAPPPPPPPAMAANAEAVRAPLQKQDPTTLTPKLTDPADAAGKAADLKSAIAGLWEDNLVIKVELHGPPPTTDDIWYLVWLVIDKSEKESEFYKIQFSLANKVVTGGVYVDDKTPVKDTLLSSEVEQQGNALIVRFPWAKLPERFQIQDVRMESVSVISAKGEKTGSKQIDVIEGHDMVRF